MKISRTKELEHFCTLCSATDTNKPRVINFYSPNSTILTDFFNEIRAYMNNTPTHDRSAGFNFKNDTTSRDGYSVKMDFLYILSRQLILCRDSDEMFDYNNGTPVLKRGFDKIMAKWNKESLFPVFDTAFVKLEKLLGQTIDEDRADPAFEIALKIFGAVQNKDLEGVYTGIRSLFEKHESSIDKKNRLNQQAILHEVEQYTNADALAENLQKYFLHDAQHYMEKYLEGNKFPFIFLLDQLESLSERDCREIQSLLLDLIPALPGTMWIIATKNKLDWKRTDLTLEHRLLGALSPDDVKSAINEIDDGFIDNVFALTQGVPIYTENCIDEFLDRRKINNLPEFQTKIKDDFFADKALLTEKYLDLILTTTPQNQIDILNMLAVYTLHNGWTTEDLLTTRKEFETTDTLRNISDEMLTDDFLAALFPIVAVESGKHKLQTDFYVAVCKLVSDEVRDMFLKTTPLKRFYLSSQAADKIKAGNYEEAECILREYADLLESSLTPSPTDVYFCQMYLGKCCIVLHKYSEAEQILRNSFPKIVYSNIPLDEKLQCVSSMAFECLLPQGDPSGTSKPIPELTHLAKDVFEYLHRFGKVLHKDTSGQNLNKDEKNNRYETVIKVSYCAYNLGVFFTLCDSSVLEDLKELNSFANLFIEK